MEHELIIQLESVAKKLEDKFNRDIQDMAIFISRDMYIEYDWYPSRCDLCRYFSPFY